MRVLVQHSAWVTKGDPQFKFAVEEIGVYNDIDIDDVRKVGGILYLDMQRPFNIEYEVNYPPGCRGLLIPRCNGTFSRQPILGSFRVYIPTHEECHRFVGLPGVEPSVCPTMFETLKASDLEAGELIRFGCSKNAHLVLKCERLTMGEVSLHLLTGDKTNILLMQRSETVFVFRKAET